MSWTFKTSDAILTFSSKSLGVVMLLDANGLFGVKIKPTIDLKCYVHDSKWTSSQSKPSCICIFKPNVSIWSAIWILIYNGKNKKLHNLVYKLTLMNYKKKSLMNFKIIIPNWNLKTIHVSLFLQHNFNITHLIAYT